MIPVVQLHDFNGGIHPPENKAQSTRTPIKQAPIAPTLIIPLNQHIGKAADPVVAVGERVLKGQCIAHAVGFISASIHAPTSGTILAIEPRPVPHASGLNDLCIILNTDGLDEWIEHPSLFDKVGVSHIDELEPMHVIEHIRASGITGLGGAGFPTSVKVQPRHAIHTVIINGAECEPYISADDMLMRERANEVVTGAYILRHTVQAERVLIAVEDNKPEAIAALKTAVEEQGMAAAMQVLAIPTKYPSGGEKQLIKILTGLEVPSGGLPADLGLLCQNVGTAAAIYRAVVLGEPLISRITTVTGEAISTPSNWEVLIGTPVAFLLNQAQYQAQKQPRVIMGGPMMGFTLPDLGVPVVKATNCLLAPTVKELPLNDFAMACIRCGLCVDACPQDLLPQQLYWFSKGQEHAKAEQHNLFDCIECGACSYVCPSHIPLVQYYRHSKGAILEERAAHEKSERARIRFEERQARHERNAAEKEAKRKARAEAAAAAQAAKAAEPAAEATGNANSVATAASVSTDTAIPAATVATPISNAAGDSPLDVMKRKYLAQEDRVNKMRERCDMARAENLSTVPTLEQALVKQQEKLQQLQQELAALEAELKG